MKMKVADLKQELKARGLSTVGSKSELVERLQAAAEVSNDLLTAVQWEKTSRDSDGERSADAVLPVGPLPTLTEGNAGAGMLSDCEGAFCIPPESMSTSAGIQDKPLPSTSERPMAGMTQRRLDDDITDQASQLNERKVAKKEDPLIGCDRCGRWAYISETDFKSSEEAEDSDFVCRICKTIDEMDTSHRTRMGELEESVNEIIQRLEGATRQGEPNETNTIRKLQDRVTELEHRVEELDKKILDSPLEGVGLNTTIVNCEESSEHDTGDNGRKQDQSDEPGPEPKDSCSCQVTGTQGSSPPTGRPHSGDPVPSQREQNLVHEDAGSREAPGPVIAGSNQAGDINYPAETRGRHPQQEISREQIRPPQGVRREVIVAGDSNVARFAPPLVDLVGNYRSMEVILNRGGTTEVVHQLIDVYEEKSRNVPRMYILHVGVNDILQGVQPDVIAERMRQKWANRKDALVVCSIPEINSRGKGIQAATMLLNAKLKKMCKDIKARFVDLSRDLRGEDAMEKDGLHYQKEGVRMVTDRLAAVACRFLGVR
ncbi:unnamed protein product, partial [Ixodes hexagonus]